MASGNIKKINATIAIPSNSDLNDYKIDGQYYCPNGTTAKTISNTPYSSGGFGLTVHRVSSGTIGVNASVIQFLYPNSSTANYFFYRSCIYTNDSYTNTNWLKLQGTAV